MSEPAAGHDAVGKLCTLTVIAPVQPGREEALRSELAALGQDAQSPLARVPGTHLARLIMIDRLPDVALRRSHLLFSAAFDAPWGGYLPAMHRALGDLTARIWGNCADYPADADADGFAAWMLARRIPARAVVAAYPQSTLEDVQRALKLRHRIGVFAARNQRRAPAEVQAAFEREFGPL